MGTATRTRMLIWMTAMTALVPAAAAATAPADQGARSWIVDRARAVAATTHLDQLVIGSAGSLTPPPGKFLTLTVNSVGTPIEPGSYHGDIAIAVTDDIPVTYHQLPTAHYRAAVYVDDGKLIVGKSVTAAATGGTVTGSAANNVTIRSDEPRFNGIIVTGNSHYTIDHPVIAMTGNGGNDFAGFGAGIMSSGHANVTVNGARIVNHGAIRTAIFVGGDSVMHVNNSMIETYNGMLPKDYKFTVEVGKMMEVPWMLGLKGNVRATNLVGNGTVYYTNSYIRSQGWGALSADDAQHVRMYVKNSLVETVESGYGAYSIGDSIDTFMGSVIDAADIGLIIAGPGSGVFTDGTVVNSGRFGVMMHSGRGGGTLTIDKGSVFNTKETAIQIKGRGTTIHVDDARLNPGNGIIVEAMPNDDPYMKKMMANAPVVGMQEPGGGSGAPGGPPDDGGMSAGSPDVIATFSNTALAGDMLNARTAEGDMTLRFKSATIAGALSTAIAAPSTGAEPTAETYYLIGAVTNTLQPTADKGGLDISLDSRSRWSVTKSCYLTRLTLAPGATIAGPDGAKATMTVDGKPVAIAPGSYAGRIVIAPAS